MKTVKNVFFGYDLQNCEHCIGCTLLRNKKYYIFNKEYSREDYFKKKEELKLNNYNNLQEVKKLFENLKQKTPRKNLNISNSGDYLGDNIFDSKNITNGYLIQECDNVKHSIAAGMFKDSADLSSVGVGELCYEFTSCGMDSYKNIFTMFSYRCQNVYYCDNCHNSSNLFGCSGLKNKQYCILNKQYSKEEYEELVPQIIAHMEKTGEWGEFLKV